MHCHSIFAISGALVLLAFLPAHAYIDPGTGSFIFQILAAGFLGALLTIKLWWGSAKRFFLRLLQKPLAESHEDSTNTGKKGLK